MIKADKVIRTNRKTISLSVDGEGRVVVRAPLKCSDKEIGMFVAASENWIRKQLEKLEESRKKTSGFEIRDNGRAIILGTEFTIRLADIREDSVEGRTIFLPKKNPEYHFKNILRRTAKNFLTERIGHFSSLTGFKPSDVRITSAKTRWGSCSTKKSVCFSLFLVMCPPDIIDYVIVHELCHIKYMNHSALFWNEVEKYIPDYKVKRKWLKDNRFIMDLI